MKIMDFDEFASMPEGTIYVSWPHGAGIYRKGKTCFGPQGQFVNYGEVALFPVEAMYLGEKKPPEINWDYPVLDETEYPEGAPREEDGLVQFAIYEAIDLDRLAVLIGRGPGWVASDEHD